MATDLEGAVERAERLAGFLGSTNLRTVLDALASITRERDEAREENKRLRTVIGGRRSVLSATIAALKSWRKRATKAEAERDAMREGLKLAAWRSRYLAKLDRKAGDGVAATGLDDIANEIDATLDRAAALVNGEGGHETTDASRADNQKTGGA